jgi:hypothetical protein
MLQVTGTLEHANFLDEFKGAEGVLYARPLVEPGAACVCVKDGLPTWCAHPTSALCLSRLRAHMLLVQHAEAITHDATTAHSVARVTARLDDRLTPCRASVFGCQLHCEPL